MALMLKDDIPLVLGAGECGSNACTSDQGRTDNLELDPSALDEFSLEASDFHEMDLSELQNEDILVLNADELRVLFEDSSDNGLESLTAEDEPEMQRPSKKRKDGWPQLPRSGNNAPGIFGTTDFGRNGLEEGRSSAANSGNVAPPYDVAAKPAIGYPCGQLPALPSDVPGVVWGLPTTPLQIIPKSNSSMNSYAGLSLSPSLHHGLPFAGMMPMPIPSSYGACLPSCTPHQGPGMRTTPVPPMFSGPQMLPRTPNASGNQGPSSSNPAALRMPTTAGSSGKCTSGAMRMPYPAMMMPFPMPPVMPPMLPPSMDVGQLAARGMMMPPLNPLKPDALSDTMVGRQGKRKENQKPPLGLQLKKSNSFADLIASYLQQSVEAS